MGWQDWIFRKPTRDRFAKSLMAGLRAAGDTRELKYDREDGSIRCGDGQINLGAIFAEHCQLPAPQRQDHLRAMVQALLPPPPLPEEFEDASHDLRPRIWARRQFSQMDADKLPPHQPVGSHLVATLVYDLPRSVRTISADELDMWGLSYYQAMEEARAQLAQDEFVFASIEQSVHCSATSDTYDASRLLLVDLINRLPLNGQPIAMAPERDRLLVTGSEDVEGLKIALQMAEESFANAARPLSPLPLCLDDDWWVDWMPPSDHPLYQAFRDLELKVLYGDYDEQKPELEQQAGDDFFVASFSAAEKEGGQLFSFSTWSRGVPTLLPRTQVVMFFDPEKNAIVASGCWEEVQNVVGHLMDETDDYPPRFVVNDFPSDDQLAAIGMIDS